MGRIALVAVCAAFTVGCAHAGPTQSWPVLVQRLAPGTPVAVTDAGGREAQGTVAAVSATALTLKTAGALREFESKDVRQVRRNGDPLWNGFAIGAAVGALGAALPDNACSGTPRTCDDRQVPERLTFLALATAAGIGIDAWRRDRTLLYGAPGRVTLSLIPIVTPDRRSLSIRIRVPGVHR